MGNASYYGYNKATLPDTIKGLLADAEQAGVYTTGISGSMGSRGPRGRAINVDVYGYDTAQELAVVQVRECYFRPGRYNRVRKDYYLLGRIEDGVIYAHPVFSPARSRQAMASPTACVAWVLSRIWKCRVEDLPEIRRQGDVAFIPATLPATAKPLVVQTITIRKSHVITAYRIWLDGNTYYVSRRAKAVHRKGEHAPVSVRNGVFRVQPGIRAGVWGFSTPYGD